MIESVENDQRNLSENEEETVENKKLKTSHDISSEREQLKAELDAIKQIYESPQLYLNNYFNRLRDEANQEMENIRLYLARIEQQKPEIEEQLRVLSDSGFDGQVPIIQQQMYLENKEANKKLNEFWPQRIEKINLFENQFINNQLGPFEELKERLNSIEMQLNVATEEEFEAIKIAILKEEVNVLKDLFQNKP